jgi:hypothetical protein
LMAATLPGREDRFVLLSEAQRPISQPAGGEGYSSAGQSIVWPIDRCREPGSRLILALDAERDVRAPVGHRKLSGHGEYAQRVAFRPAGSTAMEPWYRLHSEVDHHHQGLRRGAEEWRLGRSAGGSTRASVGAKRILPRALGETMPEPGKVAVSVGMLIAWLSHLGQAARRLG